MRPRIILANSRRADRAAKQGVTASAGDAPASGRQRKTMQHQKLPPEAIEALDTEAWFRERLRESAETASPETSKSAAKASKEALFDEAIRWFLAESGTRLELDSPEPGRQWPKVTFWVSDDLIERCERLAREHRIARSQVIALAVARFCEARVPRELVDFRKAAFQNARDLYRKLHRPKRPGSASRR
jgi:hypothetical protein